MTQTLRVINYSNEQESKVEEIPTQLDEETKTILLGDLEGNALLTHISTNSLLKPEHGPLVLSLIFQVCNFSF